MISKRRRDRNAFLAFLAAVPIALLIALPAATTTGKAYVAAKEQRQQMQAERQQMQSGAGSTAPAAESGGR
jgi:hypothetical protein